jgi:hypothetical protein
MDTLYPIQTICHIYGHFYMPNTVTAWGGNYTAKEVSNAKKVYGDKCGIYGDRIFVLGV